MALVGFLILPPEFALVVGWLWSFFADWWWLIAPPVFLFFLHDLWLFALRWQYFYSLEWTLLEIRPPQIVERTPQAMEQVFAGLHGMWTNIRPDEKYWKGKVQNWMSCEIASVNGETRFFIRVLSKYRNLVEAHVWAQYPDAEILEADDYTASVPQDIPGAVWDLWGTEFILQKPDGYPIRTYIEFEAPVEERRIDPLSALLEVMGSLGPGEQIWFHIIAEPLFDGWKTQGEELVAKLIGRPQAKRKGFMAGVLGATLGEMGKLLLEVLRIGFPQVGPPQAPLKPVRPELPSLMMHLSPGEKLIVEEIERNISKLGFRTGIRVAYLAKREVYKAATPSAIYGAIRQFNSAHLNSFVPNMHVTPSISYLFPKQRNHYRKRYLGRYLRYRLFARRRFIFNIEELATIFHFPGTMVSKAPSVTRMEAKRGEPPQTLPTA